VVFPSFHLFEVKEVKEVGHEQALTLVRKWGQTCVGGSWSSRWLNGYSIE
jgi:hypothetical protein